jgi:hypothetical protein
MTVEIRLGPGATPSLKWEKRAGGMPALRV